MRPEATIFIGYQHVDETGIHGVVAYRKAPPPIFDRVGSQQIAVIVQHLDTSLQNQRRNFGPVDPIVDPQCAACAKRSEEKPKGGEDPSDHRTTRTRPDAVWAR